MKTLTTFIFILFTYTLHAQQLFHKINKSTFVNSKEVIKINGQTATLTSYTLNTSNIKNLKLDRMYLKNYKPIGKVFKKPEIIRK